MALIIEKKVQIDITYVLNECIRFPCYGDKYYQITAIDEHSRKRILKILKKKSTYETGKFLSELEKLIGFCVKGVQVDNRLEFANDEYKNSKAGRFERIVKELNIKLRRTRPYSPWQNGKV